MTGVKPASARFRAIVRSSRWKASGPALAGAGREDEPDAAVRMLSIVTIERSLGSEQKQA